MALRTMYPPQKDSPSTFLLGDITATDVLLTVGNAAIFPPLIPYPLTLGIDKNVTETVMMTAINLGSNQITVTRGTPALVWQAGTKIARVLTAKDFKDLQDNVTDAVTDLNSTKTTVATQGTDINTLKTTVGGASSGLVKGLADEITRAKAAEDAEKTRAQAAETNLNTTKVNRSELAQVITDWTYSSDPTKVLVTITRYNASNQQVTQYTRTLPIVSDENMGVMTPEAYAEITALRNDVNALQQLGGRFIGVSFATKAALDAYVVPPVIKMGDYTYVLDDETKSGSTTRYVYNGSVFNFTFVVEYDPVGLANPTTPGLVKSDGGATGGKVFVETDGTMSVIGWDAITQTINGKLSTSGGTMSGPINMGGNHIENLYQIIGSAANPLWLAPIEGGAGYPQGLYISARMDNPTHGIVGVTLDTDIEFQSPLDMCGNKIIGLGAPTSSNDAVNKQYADKIHPIDLGYDSDNGWETTPLLKQLTETGYYYIVENADAFQTVVLHIERPNGSATQLIFPGEESGAVYIRSRGGEDWSFAYTLATGWSITDLANKHIAYSTTVIVSAWTANTTYGAQGYNWRASIAHSTISNYHKPDVTFPLAEALSGNFAPIAESYYGGIYIYAKEKPTANIVVGVSADRS